MKSEKVTGMSVLPGIARSEEKTGLTRVELNIRLKNPRFAAVHTEKMEGVNGIPVRIIKNAC